MGVFAAGMMFAPGRVSLPSLPGWLTGHEEAAEAADSAPVVQANAADAARGTMKPVSPAATAAVAAGLPSLSPLVKAVGPAVVNLKVQTKARQRISRNGGGQRPRTPFDDFFGPGFMDRFWDQMPNNQPQSSLGSGFIIDKSGLVLTNNHVIDNAEDIVMVMRDNREFHAKVVGRDPKIDIALLKAEADTELPAVDLGNSDQIDVGDWVLAIGNPFGLSNTVTLGIVSAKGREIGAGPYDDFIQTDTAINPGNSGGPLLSLDGRVVGVNTAINAAAQGIGFAIPVNMIKDLLPQLKEGRVRRAWLGVFIQPLDKDLSDALGLKEQKGALVAQVVKDSPADKAGIKDRDVILRFNGQTVEKQNDLPRVVAASPIGKPSQVDIFRDGKRQVVQVVLTEMKDEAPAGGPEAEGDAETSTTDVIGIEVNELTPDLRSRAGVTPDVNGAFVTQVEPNSPAFQAGIRPGDVIVDAGSRPVKTVKDLVDAVKEARPSGRVLFRVIRQGQPRLLVVKLK